MWPLFCSVQVYISLYFLLLWICNFPLSLFNKRLFFVKLFTQSYSILLILLLTLFLFLSASSIFLNKYFFRWLACKSFSRCSVLSYNIFSVSSCFPSFSGLRFFSNQVFQDLTRGSGPIL